MGSLVFAAMAFAAPGPDAEAEPRPPMNRVVWSADTKVRVNSAWLGTTHRLVYRRRLWRSEKAALRGAGVEVGALASVWAGGGQGGAVVRVQPVTPLVLHASVQGLGGWGASRFVQSFGTVSEPFGPLARAERDSEVRGGWVAHMGLKAQFKLGPIGLVSDSVAGRWDLGLPDGQVAFYEPDWDLLIADGGWAFSQEVRAAWLLGRPSLGLMWAYRQAFHAASDVDSVVPIHQLGPWASLSLGHRPGSAFDRPTLYAKAAWYLVHPYRRGVEVPGVVPMIEVGFAFRGDLLPWTATEAPATR